MVGRLDKISILVLFDTSMLGRGFPKVFDRACFAEAHSGVVLAAFADLKDAAW